MKKSKLISCGFLNSVGVLVYIALVSFALNNGEKLFGKMPGVQGPVALLMLFVLSAAVTGLLVLGRPIYLYFEGAKTEAVKLLFYTVGWLFALTVLIFLFFWIL